MVFWRSKPAKSGKTVAGSSASDNANAAAKDADKAADAIAADSNAESTDDRGTTNVVPLIGQKLTERLAERAGQTDTSAPLSSSDGSKLPVKQTEATRDVAASSQRALGAARRGTASVGLDGLQKAIYGAKPGRHIIAIAGDGADCRDEARRLAEIRAQALEAAPDWIYVLDPANAGRFLTFSLPHGDGPRFVRDATAAIDKAAAMFARMMASDAYRLSLDLIEENVRQRVDQLLENVRRRADSQNIAVIRSLDGYVLAPMHDGKVVRPDVFRALPERLRRDVEAKIKELEKDLQAVIATMPEAEVETDDKLQVLVEQTALRAVKPTLSVLRKVYGSKADFDVVFERLEQSFVRYQSAAARNPASVGQPGVPVLLWSAIGGNGDATHDGAPVVLLRTVDPRDLCGEIGRDAVGATAIRPGDLMRGNGGIVIVEGWRLAAEPRGWSVLSSILDRGTLTPLAGSGIAVQAQPVPLSITLVLIADAAALARLEEIDPGCVQHFAVLTAVGDTAVGEAVS